MNCIDLANALQIAFKMGRETGTTPATREEVQQQFDAFVGGQCQKMGLVLQSLDYWKDVAASRAATPAPVEPVAWMIRSRTGLIRCCLTEEPDDERRALAEIDGDTITPLFAAPLAATPESHVQRAPAPAPLTDEQIDKTAKRVIPVAAYMGMFEYAAFSKEDADRTVRHFARAIEAAHGIGASTKESNQ